MKALQIILCAIVVGIIAYLLAHKKKAAAAEAQPLPVAAPTPVVVAPAAMPASAATTVLTTTVEPPTPVASGATTAVVIPPTAPTVPVALNALVYDAATGRTYAPNLPAPYNTMPLLYYWNSAPMSNPASQPAYLPAIPEWYIACRNLEYVGQIRTTLTVVYRGYYGAIDETTEIGLVRNDLRAQWIVAPSGNLVYGSF